MILRSDYRPLIQVRLPYAGRQKYMHSFDLEQPVMAAGFEDYLDPVKSLCAAAGAFVGEAHMTVDEKEVLPGQTQRRPGPHVDGCFIPARQAWGHVGGWLHGCNDIRTGAIGRMAIIVASSVAGCKAWRGDFVGQPKNDGDLSHIALGDGELLPAFTGFVLSPDCIHESLPMTERVCRTFLRIALPIEYDFWRAHPQDQGARP